MFKNLYLAGMRGLLIYVRRGNCVRENGMCTASTRTFLERNKQSIERYRSNPLLILIALVARLTGRIQ